MMLSEDETNLFACLLDTFQQTYKQLNGCGQNI